MTKTQTLVVIPALGVLMLLGGAIAGYTGLASAQSGGMMGVTQGTPHVGGVITAINGSMITIAANPNHGGGTNTIETSGATFTKASAPASLSSFAIGDKIRATGTLNGTTLTATAVTDMPAFGIGGRGGHGKGHGVMGEVTALNGSTITITGKDGQSYTVNAGSATIQKMTTGSLSDIVVGDTIGVQGAVSGSSVTATMIMDDVQQHTMKANQQ